MTEDGGGTRTGPPYPRGTPLTGSVLRDSSLAWLRFSSVLCTIWSSFLPLSFHRYWNCLASWRLYFSLYASLYASLYPECLILYWPLPFGESSMETLRFAVISGGWEAVPGKCRQWDLKDEVRRFFFEITVDSREVAKIVQSLTYTVTPLPPMVTSYIIKMKKLTLI